MKTENSIIFNSFPNIIHFFFVSKILMEFFRIQFITLSMKIQKHVNFGYLIKDNLQIIGAAGVSRLKFMNF